MLKRQLGGASRGPFVRRMETDVDDETLEVGQLDATALIAALNRLFKLAGLALRIPEDADGQAIMETLAKVPPAPEGKAPPKAPAAVAAQNKGGRKISPIQLGFAIAKQQRKAKANARRLRGQK